MAENRAKNQYRLESDGRFVIQDFQNQKPFSNFLPGIAGLYGIPMWVFYVNRGQGIASFGIRNKDHAMLEFFPANKAYQMASSVGFRTFVKYRTADSNQPASSYEPFRAFPAGGQGRHQVMEVSAHEMSVSDFDEKSGLRTQAIYYTVPGEPIASLVRELTITNESRKALDLDVLDGLPSVNPYGMNEFFVKHMSRTIEAWMITENMGKKAPFFHLRVDATDRPEVEVIHEGNFYFGLVEARDGSGELAEPVVDPARIFGARLDFIQPDVFFHGPSSDVLSGQVTDNKTPCAFSYASVRVPVGGSLRLRSYFGHARDIETLNRFVARARRADFGKTKRAENQRVVDQVRSRTFTLSASAAYDLYCGQTYLDNILRGGMPVRLTGGPDPLVYYVYSRKHGDLERDYNRFLVEPSYLAQGDGNYRDVNQNRRQDVWFEPRVGEANIRTFLNLIQLDGFNPLVVKGDDFHFRKTAASTQAVTKHFGAKLAAPLFEYLKKPFKLGDFCRFLENQGMAPSSFPKAIEAVAPFLDPEEKAEHGEGFWVDHWTYNLDLIESYLAVFPEHGARLLFGSKDYRFYDNDHVVQPRQKKYFLHKPEEVRQFKAVVKDREKTKLLAARPSQASWVRTRQGEGEIYKTSLFVKLFCLFVNKLSSLDPHGAGIEMEAEKPSWYDALNGLPGLLGSSLCETFELKRLAVFLIQAIDDLGVDPRSSLLLPEELADFYAGLEKLLSQSLSKKGASRDFEFWDEAADLREEYRSRTRLGISGREKAVAVAKARLFLERGREKIQLGIEKSFDPKTGLYPTYFENEVLKFRTQKKGDGSLHVTPAEFGHRPLPFFLEGPVHALKVEKDTERRRALVRAVRESGLYDKKLGMYKVNSDMSAASLDVGRARVFKPGWLENESIWLHMEYKWLVELLKSGLADEYFADFRRALVPFQPAERYGRSVLENSSFIVSSVFTDASLHGAGFVARLSGSTAEFLNLWLLMNAGRRPFTLGPDKKISLRFEPCLPSFLFTQEETSRVWTAPDGTRQSLKLPKNSFGFLFLGKTLVVYHNPKRMDTFGKNRAWPKKIRLSSRKGRLAEFDGGVISDPWAKRVRDEDIVTRIDIELG